MKGQYLDIPAFVTGVLIVGAVPFVPLMMGQQATIKLEYSEHDMPVLIEATQRREVYKQNIRHEMNYSYNNAGYVLGLEGGGKKSWEKIPEKNFLKRQVKAKTFGSDIGLKRQSRVYECTEPKLRKRDFDIVKTSAGWKLKLGLEGRGIRCGNKGAEAKVFFTGSVVHSPKVNKYLPIAYDARQTAIEAKKIIESKDWQKEAVATACKSQKSSSKEAASKLGKKKIKEALKHGNIAEKAFKKEEHPEYVKGWNLITKYQLQTSEKNNFYVGDCGCEEWSPPDSEGSRFCEDWKKRYLSKWEGKVNEIKMGFRFNDSSTKIWTWRGKKRLQFRFKYILDQLV